MHDLITRAAYHESGHAVCAVSLRVPLTSASIDETGGGVVMLAAPDDVSPLNDISLTAAGVLAERIVHPSRMLEDDSKDAIDIRKALGKGGHGYANWKESPILDVGVSIARRTLDRYQHEVSAFANLLLSKRRLNASEITCALWSMRPHPEPSAEEMRLRERARRELPSARIVETAADALFCLRSGLPVQYATRDNIDLGYEAILYQRFQPARDKIKVAAVAALAYGSPRPSEGYEDARAFVDDNGLSILRVAAALSRRTLSSREIQLAARAPA